MRVKKKKEKKTQNVAERKIEGVIKRFSSKSTACTINARKREEMDWA